MLSSAQPLEWRPQVSSDWVARPLLQMLARRSADFRLDPRLVLLCREDITTTCSTQFHTIGRDEGQDGRVIECLQDSRDELKVRRDTKHGMIGGRLTSCLTHSEPCV